MPVKPWLCWKAQKALPSADPVENPTDHIKPLLQLKALKTKCFQRKVALRQRQESLQTVKDRVRAAQEIWSAKDARPDPGVTVSSCGEEEVETAEIPKGYRKDVWETEASSLATALQERRTLNECLRFEAG